MSKYLIWVISLTNIIAEKVPDFCGVDIYSINRFELELDPGTVPLLGTSLALQAFTAPIDVLIDVPSIEELHAGAQVLSGSKYPPLGHGSSQVCIVALLITEDTGL